MHVRSLINKVKKYNPKADLEQIRKAYDFAYESHGKQFRESGESFIFHPLKVADILANLRLDTPTIVAALLHDVVEDTSLSLTDIESEFGREVRDLIDGVTKLSKIEFKTQEEQQAENLRKMLIAMAKDIRVLLIKLADRLHNMQTLSAIPRDKQKQKAAETLEIYAPLAHRMGISSLKWELEDLAFANLESKKYAQIQKMVAQKREEREAYLREVLKLLRKELSRVGIKSEVSGRPKQFYSIYEKMIKKGKDFNEIYDLTAVRVIVSSVRDCYAAIGTIHALWKPVPGRFKDYIAMPKFNMYQSLHTTVIGPEGSSLEIQIRSEVMHRTAEFGIAAHWRYKEVGEQGEKLTERTAWLKEMLNWQREQKDPKDFMENLRIDLFEDEVFVFTPKGDIKSLPKGATPIDFAYSIHTDIGNSLIGAKVNNKIVSIEYQLRNGDIIEILTSKSATGPSKDWLKIAKSSKARNKVRQWFSMESRKDSEHLGRDILLKVLRKEGVSVSLSKLDNLLEDVIERFNFANVDNLYASIGQGKTSARQVTTRVINSLKIKEADGKVVDEGLFEIPQRTKKKVIEGSGIKVEGVENVLVRLAHCCSPVPPDEIIGFVTRGRGVSVHRKDCLNAQKLLESTDRLIEVTWDTEKPVAFPAEIQVEALDRTKLLRDISSIISDSGVNILSATVSTGRNQTAIFRFVFEVGSLSHLENVLANIRKVDTVFDVHRVMPK